jgi:hypothetical protein
VNEIIANSVVGAATVAIKAFVLIRLYTFAVIRAAAVALGKAFCAIGVLPAAGFGAYAIPRRRIATGPIGFWTDGIVGTAAHPV